MLILHPTMCLCQSKYFLKSHSVDPLEVLATKSLDTILCKEDGH